jgi:sensor domain CHASE-containing protein
MPHSNQHSNKKVKNYLIFALLLLFVAVVFSITILKMHKAAVQEKSKVLHEEKLSNSN